jgi:dTDP-4-dehydrorhamnose 3,5-epimerase/CDP-3, 6-dideoxy-D-glycero-D-glycero-4-hexulose-5-epimerase
MEIENTFISGLKLLHLNKFEDSRGSFLKVFNEEMFKENSLAINFKESYYSISKKNVLRGMHFQIPPFEHTKLVYLNHGEILDVVLDIRKTSQTYGKHFSIKLDTKKPILIYIPIGCAHGFISLTDDTIVTYMQTTVYNKECDTGILWSSFDMKWEINKPIISDRDNLFLDFNTFNSPF